MSNWVQAHQIWCDLRTAKYHKLRLYVPLMWVNAKDRSFVSSTQWDWHPKMTMGNYGRSAGAVSYSCVKHVRAVINHIPLSTTLSNNTHQQYQPAIFPTISTNLSLLTQDYKTFPRGNESWQTYPICAQNNMVNKHWYTLITNSNRDMCHAKTENNTSNMNAGWQHLWPGWSFSPLLNWKGSDFLQVSEINSIPGLEQCCMLVNIGEGGDEL